jgi:hypothetical protein
MFIKRVALASAAVLGLLSFGCTTFANPIIPGQAGHAGETASVMTGTFLKVADEGNNPRNYHRRRFARHRSWHEGYRWYDRHRDSGPPYSACYMKCIYSSHPADFCKNVARDHFCY